MKDNIKKLWNFLKSKVFLINLGAALAVLVLSFVVLSVSLKSYTRHGESVTVPTLVGMKIDDAIALIKENGFNYEIVDTVFDDKHDKGAIVEQNPKAESLVKEGRKIYLIVNSNNDEMISMPQLVGFTMKQVNLMMQTYGLAVGSIRYVPDIAVNVVIRQMHNGVIIEAGEKIKKGSEVDFVLGFGISDKTTSIPSVIGLTYRDASNRLLDLYLNTGSIRYDNTIKNRNDSLNAKVYRQSPQGSTINEINLGYNVDIWLTKDQSLLNSAKDEEADRDDEKKDDKKNN